MPYLRYPTYFGLSKAKQNKAVVAMSSVYVYDKCIPLYVLHSWYLDSYLAKLWKHDGMKLSLLPEILFSPGNPGMQKKQELHC